jgi:AraC-like DNA-binding protein
MIASLCEALMTVQIATDDVRPGEREEYWRVALRNSFVPVDLVTLDASRLSGSVRTSQVGNMLVAQMSSSAQEIRRTHRHVDQQEQQLIHVAVATHGSGILTQDDRVVRMSPGEIVIYETARPFEVRFDDRWDASVLTVPRHLVPLTEEETTRLTARPLNRHGRLGGIVGRTVADLAEHVDQMPSALADKMLKNLGDLVLEVVRAELSPERADEEDPVPKGPEYDIRRARLISSIKDFIEQQLPDPWLTPTSIAEAHHMSVRSLHQLFSPTGTTVAAYVRRRRLSRCAQMLRDPRNCELSILSIARDVGFSDASGFGRAFKAIYGMTPSDYRGH